jgi:hypothetical protein
MENQTLREIDNILGVINTHPEYRECIAREKRNALANDARKYSLALEREEGDRAHANLLKAEDYLNRYGLGVSTISRLGFLIEPERCRDGFRNVDPEFPNQVIESDKFSKFVAHPPRAREVQSQVGNLLSYLNESEDHPVIRAAEAHLELCRIHPFAEGNGRASRILQNYCLVEKGYPIAIINDSERGLYYKLIQDALKERTNLKSSSLENGDYDVIFHEFIASKVLSSARDLRDFLESHRAYDIRISNPKDAGIIHSLARRLRSRGKACGEGIKVSVNKTNHGKKGAVLRVIGDIGKDEVEGVLESCRDHRFRYNVEVLGCK